MVNILFRSLTFSKLEVLHITYVDVCVIHIFFKYLLRVCCPVCDISSYAVHLSNFFLFFDVPAGTIS